MTTKILITGGAGYLGSVLTQMMLVLGYEVTVLDNFMYRQQSLSHLAAYPKLRIIRKDARWFGAYIDEADVIVPLAALVGAPLCAEKEEEAWATNLRSVKLLVANAHPNKIVIYPNTNSGYGIGGEEMCTEESPLQPISIYGKSKVEAEKVVLNHPNGVVLRFATLFGASPRMRLDLMVNHFVHRAVTDKALTIFEPHFRRNFLHVRDAASAIIHAIHHVGVMRGQSYNAGRDDANMSKGALAAKIKEHLPDFHFSFAEQGSDPDKRDYLVSNAKIKATGWEAQYSIDEGIAELVRCFQQPFSAHGNV